MTPIFNIIYSDMNTNINKYSDEEVFGYIYIIIMPDDRYYIGQKRHHPKDTQTYYGSGTHLKNLINKLTGFPSRNLPVPIANKFGIHKYILDYAKNQDELNLLERYYIKLSKNYEYTTCGCLNIHSGGGYPFYRPPGKFILKEDSIKKAMATKKMKRELGITVTTEETRKKMSIGIKEALKKKPIWNKGLTKDSDDRVRLICENADRSFMKTEKYKQTISKVSKGSKWYNNGIINIRLFDDEEIPNGFVSGMIGKPTEKKDVSRRCFNVEDGNYFNTIDDASKFYNCTNNSIIASCEKSATKSNPKESFAYVNNRYGKYVGRFIYLD